jgi:hypothetical protein
MQEASLYIYILLKITNSSLTCIMSSNSDMHGISWWHWLKGIHIYSQNVKPKILNNNRT